MLFKILYFICWLPVKILLPIKKIGKENLIKGKAILCCNHQTNLDCIPLFYLAKSKVFALCKKELYNTKFKRWFFNSMKRGIPIDRQKPEISSIKKCLEVLNNGNNLMVFPQGTRSSKEDIEGLKQGVAMFCLKTKAPLIPMVYLKKNKLFRRNTLVIGKPIEFDLSYSKENCEIVINKLEEEMIKLQKYEVKK